MLRGSGAEHAACDAGGESLVRAADGETLAGETGDAQPAGTADPEQPVGSAAGEPVVRAADVHKSYAGVPAVRGVDLAVHRGETFGFLGPNGAGKTTMIAMLCTLALPDSGSIEIAGHDAVRNPRRVRRNLGLVHQESTLDCDLTAAENLRSTPTSTRCRAPE